jgi:type II secretory pathway component PulF
MPVYAQLIYLMVVAIATCLVLNFISIMIMPTLAKMFDEFGLSLPMLWLSQGNLGAWVAGAVLLLLLGVALTIGIASLPAFGRSWLPSMPARARRKAETLYGIADAVDAGWPIGRGLAMAHAISLRAAERRQLESAMRAIEQGSQPLAALRQSGLITADQEAWFTDTSGWRTADRLRQIADRNVRDSDLRLQWFLALFFPAVVVFLGAVVFACGLAFFVVLLELVSGLS